MIRPPPEELPPARAALSGAWEGARGPDGRFWLVVVGGEPGSATAYYGGAEAESDGRPYGRRYPAQTFPDGRLNWATSEGGDYALSLAPDFQQLTGTVRGRVSGRVIYTYPVSLSRCAG